MSQSVTKKHQSRKSQENCPVPEFEDRNLTDLRGGAASWVSWGCKSHMDGEFVAHDFFAETLFSDHHFETSPDGNHPTFFFWFSHVRSSQCLDFYHDSCYLNLWWPEAIPGGPRIFFGCGSGGFRRMDQESWCSGASAGALWKLPMNRLRSPTSLSSNGKSWYPLVMTNIAVENHHLQRENPLQVTINDDVQ